VGGIERGSKFAIKLTVSNVIIIFRMQTPSHYEFDMIMMIDDFTTVLCF